MALSAPLARARAEAPAVDLDVTLDPDQARLDGQARLRITNRTGVPIQTVPLWLYPNHLARRAPALTDITYHWLYPGLFSPAGMDVAGARVAGAPVAVTLADTPAGARTLAQVTLPAPLAPGAETTLEIAFHVRVPRRFGGFGCDGLRCRFMGGFYPMPAAQVAGGFDLKQAPAHTGPARLTVRALRPLALVVNGQPVVWPGAGQPVTVESEDVPYPTLVTDRVLRPETITVGRHLVRYLHRKPRPPGSEDQPLPYVREDISALVLATAQRALALADSMLREAPRATADAALAAPITLIEAPLRHQLVQQHGTVVLVSDQIFRIFPVNRLRKYHHLELVRAIVKAVLDARLAAVEPPADRTLASGVLAAYLTELYAVSQFQRLEYASDLLRPFDFVPAVDQLLYAPQLASSSSYFGDVGAHDAIRDDVRLFADPDAPGPRLVYNKLLDLLGASAFPDLARRMLNQRQPLRQAAAETFGADLGWFWRQWLGPLPRVNYRLQAVRVSPAASGPGVHVEIDVRREGAALREPVEVLIQERSGARQLLRWDDDRPSHLFAVDLSAGLKSVELDPRERLVESAVGSLRPSDDPRYDDRRPPRWRFLYQGFGALLNISELAANFEAAFLLKPQHDPRHAVLMTAFHSETTQFGVGGAYYYNFGRQVTRNSLSSSALGGLTLSRINPSFGLAATDRALPGYRMNARLALLHDTRDFLYDPWHAVGFDVGVDYSLIALEGGGGTLSQVSAGAGALRLFELAPGHVAAVDGQFGITGGDILLPGQLTRAGGPGGLRGYFADELLARATFIGSLQLRDDYVSGLDWNLLHFTSVRGFAGTLFFDAAALTSCDGYAFSRNGVYYDVGYSFRVLHDAFGVYQQLFSIDFAVPLNRHQNGATCLGRMPAPVSRPPFVVLLSFVPSF